MAKTKNRIKSQRSSGVVSPVVIILVVAAALLIVGGMIVLNNQTSRAEGIGQFPAKGSETAPVTMIEYSDYGCSHCRDFVLEKADELDAQYVETGKVRYIVHPFYLGSPEMELATEAAWCAADQGKFFQYQRALFENQGQLTYDSNSLIELGKDTGLDTNVMAACLSSGQHRADVEKARQAAARRGINSTPTFFINNRRVVGDQPYQVFQQTIEQELAAAAK